MNTLFFTIIPLIVCLALVYVITTHFPIIGLVLCLLGIGILIENSYRPKGNHHD